MRGGFGNCIGANRGSSQHAERAAQRLIATSHFVLSAQIVGSRIAQSAAIVVPDLVATTDNNEWSLSGAPWLQPVAISGKSDRRAPRESKISYTRT